MGVTMAMMKFPIQLAAVVSEMAIPGKAKREKRERRERERERVMQCTVPYILAS